MLEKRKTLCKSAPVLSNLLNQKTVYPVSNRCTSMNGSMSYSIILTLEYNKCVDMLNTVKRSKPATLKIPKFGFQDL